MTLSPTSPMRSSVMALLIMEILVLWLGFAGMVQVSGARADVAAGATAVVTVLCIAAAAGLRRGWGYWVGHLAQVGAVLLGLLTPWMYVMGGVFALIWVTAIVLGRRIESRQREMGS